MRFMECGIFMKGSKSSCKSSSTSWRHSTLPFSIVRGLDLAWRGRGRSVLAIMLVSGFGSSVDGGWRGEEEKIWFQIQSHFSPNLRDHPCRRGASNTLTHCETKCRCQFRLQKGIIDLLDTILLYVSTVCIKPRTMYLWLNRCPIGSFVASTARFTFDIVGVFLVGSSVWWIARLGSSQVCYMVQYFCGADLFERRDSRWCRHHMMCDLYLICSYIHSGGNFGG